MMEFNDWSEEDKTRYIIENLSKSKLNKDDTDLIQGWLVSDVNSETKDKVLQDKLDDFFNEGRKPDEWTDALFTVISKKLGFPATEKKTTTRLIKRNIFRVAAVIIPVLILSGTLVMLFNHKTDSVIESPAIEYVAVSTDHGKQNRIVLSDGSVVTLAEGSELLYADNFDDNRSLKLSGEAFFSVVKKDGKPFIVDTENIRITVLGTEFNLRAYPDDMETVISLESGSIEVTDKNHVVMLKPMEELRYNNRTGDSEITTLPSSLIDRLRTGQKELIGLPLEETLREIARFYGKKLQIKGSLPTNHATAITLSDTSSITVVLQAVRFMSDESFDYKIENDTIYVSKK